MESTTNPQSGQNINGIRGYIYRHNQKVSPANLLGPFESVVIVGEGITGTAYVSEREPAVYLANHRIIGGMLRIVKPVGHEEKWLMHDGDFIYSNQPDFENMFGKGQFVKLYDRYEGK